MSNIFATGTSGTIGKHFVSKVSAIDIDLRGPEKAFIIPKISPSNFVLHAAGIVGTAKVNSDPEQSYAINVNGSTKLAEFARDINIARFVFVSSAHVYAKTEKILTESSDINPTTLYAKQKFEAEKNIIEIFEGRKEKLCIVRVFSVLDWDSDDFTLGGAITRLTRLNLNETLINVDDVRDFLTPKQVANALVAITNKTSLTGIVNLCSGIGTSVLSAARKMLEVRGLPFPTERILRGKSDNPYIVGDNSKLTSYLPNLDLSWAPSTRADF